MTTIGVLIFDDAEELDFVGPWEVFTSAAALAEEGSVKLIAERADPVRCAKGMRVLPDHTFADAPPLDVVLVPGGRGTRREMHNEALLTWLRGVAAKAAWVTSVCTGSLVLAEAGLCQGKRVTTHHSIIAKLRERTDLTVVDGVRFVRDGNVVTAAGVSAGIDMALWLVGQLRSPDFARRVQGWIEYHPAPPYSAET